MEGGEIDMNKDETKRLAAMTATTRVAKKKETKQLIGCFVPLCPTTFFGWKSVTVACYLS